MDGTNYNNVRPKNAGEAKIWNSLNGRSWDWYPIREWPIGLAKAVIEGRLNNRWRFTLFMFLVGNGMAPTVAQETILNLGRNYFDTDAIRHIAWLTKNFLIGKLNKYTYFDLYLHKIV